MPEDGLEIHSVPATTHGRVLVRRAAAAPRGILAGFHGYFENAAIQLERLASIPLTRAWTLISVQALHRVYRGRSPAIAASWMTSEDRDAAIADNVAYVASAVDLVAPAASTPVVYAGFSQGGQMAFRAALRGKRAPAGIVSVGSDVPPELLADASLRFPPVLLARGTNDEWYTAEKFAADVAALRALGAPVEAFVYEGGHDWTNTVGAAAAEWIERTASASSA
jgi:predicted esterase